MIEEDRDEDEANKDVLPETIDCRRIKVEIEEAPKSALALLWLSSILYLLYLYDFLSTIYFPSSRVFVLMENRIVEKKNEVVLPVANCLLPRIKICLNNIFLFHFFISFFFFFFLFSFFFSVLERPLSTPLPSFPLLVLLIKRVPTPT